MKIPIIQGIIDRRILVNYRIDPDVLARVLPPPFRPKLVEGHGIAGICLIRLTRVRPWFFPAIAGMSSENAAHRIAVEWDDDGRHHQGVFIPRRDTSSRLNSIIGGRLFPGTHHHARFDVSEHDNHFRIRMHSDDDASDLTVDARIAAKLPDTSLFRTVKDVSEFFERGSLGYSPAAARAEFDGLELRTFSWHVDPLAIEHVASSYFQNQRLFPRGTVEFDCALLMRGIRHEWHSRPSIPCCTASEAVASTR